MDLSSWVSCLNFSEAMQAAQVCKEAVLPAGKDSDCFSACTFLCAVK